MSMQNPSAAHEAAVFIDLESLGSFPTKRQQRYYEDLFKVIDALPGIVARYGFTPSDYWAVAHAFREKNNHLGKYFLPKIYPHEQQKLSEKLSSRNVTVSWCKEVIADLALIAEVERRLKEKSLPECVVFVTNDGDFAALGQKIANTGRFVVVVGYNHSRRWKPVTSAIHAIHDILGEPFPQEMGRWRPPQT